MSESIQAVTMHKVTVQCRMYTHEVKHRICPGHEWYVIEWLSGSNVVHQERFETGEEAKAQYDNLREQMMQPRHFVMESEYNSTHDK